MKLPDLERFIASDPMLDVWRRYPAISEDEDDATDHYACMHASRDFAEFLHRAGVDAQLVHVEFLHPFAGRHWWVRVGDQDYDWTARQYHNLEHPPLPEHADIAFPLVWPAGEPHPIVGEYEVVEVSADPLIEDDLTRLIKRGIERG